VPAPPDLAVQRRVAVSGAVAPPREANPEASGSRRNRKPAPGTDGDAFAPSTGERPAPDGPGESQFAAAAMNTAPQSAATP
jgi:hypothetical protein